MNVNLFEVYSMDKMNSLVDIREASEKLYNYIKDNYGLEKKRIYACIGTPKLVGDSFGPRVGNLIDKYVDKGFNCEVMGNIREPLHALNIEERTSYIEDNSVIIAIDSCVSSCGNRDIVIENNGIKPGLACKKELGLLGDISILSRIREDKSRSLQELLESVKEEDIESQATFVAHVIVKVEEMIACEEK